ncbi:hypothetical protein VitviT2T_018682 [Vitis vinifera]|uniref:Protein kinase domain-containing protein n=1 Tax=Vitis vinifera TaxID=29760 RepID=A0ABY9D0P4_VITVI|nr:mitogen-activated protein kinase kinase kinase 20-like [Vitis vinifera]WKA00315.1 hypothetical protein VitviT2T_018682 [Vitis vinifera]|eukprot:XP_003633375.1 PREDICTED: mitogen-activated protein kinase kinase kinase NPK1-like [Vitis vinifera]
MENIMVKGRLLGMGNFAHVHLAYCRPFGGQFAVKSVNSSLSSSLLMEETILRRLRCSPDVVYCFGGYSTQEANGDSAYNLVLEYAAGGSLGRLMFSRTSGSPESEVQWYTRMIVRGLHAVHREGFVHCDLKLSNMLLFPTEDGRWRVKIADFGLSKRFGREEFCRPLTFRGTANYMSPESIVYSENEAPLDIWCLGCMVIEMFTGKPTWENCKDENDLILHIVFWRQVPLIPENISEEAKDFLKKCLARDPSQRWTAEMLLTHPFIDSVLLPL